MVMQRWHGDGGGSKLAGWAGEKRCELEGVYGRRRWIRCNVFAWMRKKVRKEIRKQKEWVRSGRVASPGGGGRNTSILRGGGGDSIFLIKMLWLRVKFTSVRKRMCKPIKTRIHLNCPTSKKGTRTCSHYSILSSVVLRSPLVRITIARGRGE
jgi:hypothetical protein